MPQCPTAHRRGTAACKEMFKQEITVLQTGSCGCRDETEPGKNSYFDFAARNGHACRGSEVGLIKDELRIAHQMHVYCLQTYACKPGTWLRIAQNCRCMDQSHFARLREASRGFSRLIRALRALRALHTLRALRALRAKARSAVRALHARRLRVLRVGFARASRGLHGFARLRLMQPAAETLAASMLYRQFTTFNYRQVNF